MPALIRLAQSTDAAAIAAIYAPYCDEGIVSFETVAPTADEMSKRITKITQLYPWLVLEDKSEIAGYVYASQHRERAAYQWSVDITAYTHDNYQRRGVGRALYTSLFELLRLQGYFKAYAGIAQPNEASVGLHQSLGMSLVGLYRGVGYKLGAWHDVAWYQASLQPEQSNPQPALSIRTILIQPEGQTALNAGLAYYRGTS